MSTTETSKALLITGATGKQGGAVINALLAANADFQILALTRNAESGSAKALLKKSDKIKLVVGNLDDCEDVFKKAEEIVNGKVWGVFSVQVPMGSNASAATEEAQGKSLVTSALAHSVSHFVYTSVDRGGAEKSATDATNIPHFISKFNVEQHLFEQISGKEMTYTVLRPVAFMENLVPGFVGKVFSTSWDAKLAKEKKLQLVATSDIGFFAAQAFIKPQDPVYKNQSISLAGDELTFDEYKSVFEKTTGETLPLTYRFVAVIINWMVKELGYMFKWFGDVGYGADIPSLKKLNPELQNFETWLQKESAWAKKSQ